MNKSKKIFLIIAIVIAAILLITGVTYAVLSYEKEGETQELIVGDIWMKYTETNQLVLEDAMPMSIDNYTSYKVNPVMATQEINELTRCVNIYTNWGYQFDEGSDAESYCKGIGTAYGGLTIQENLDVWSKDEYFLEDGGQELLDAGVILQYNENYIVNPIMATQEVKENELSRCIALFNKLESPYDEGTTAESLCKGEGTIMNGMTLQQFWDENNQEDGFMDFIGNYLIKDNIIIPRIENLPYFEFTISGKNTYTKKDIWYEIVLNHGEEHEIRTTRISDNLLRFSLIEIKDGIETTVINNRKYDDLNNKRIWVNTIDKNTNEEVSITYRLYMWIDENTIIGNNKEDYTLEEWEDVFASIKVNVTGDFNEKELVYEVTDESCFETEISTEYIVNSNMTEEELNTCVTIHREQFGMLDEYIDRGNTLENYCRGTATSGNLNFQGRLLEFRYNHEELNLLVENNIVSSEESVSITNYNETCGNDIIIPSIINGYNVRYIGHGAFNNKGLYNVVLPNTIIGIYEGAFTNNYISSVEIPNSVKYLFCYAFDENINIKKSSDLVCLIVQ